MQLRCCDSSCLCKYALLRGLTPLHNSVPLLYRKDTLTAQKGIRTTRIFQWYPYFRALCSVFVSVQWLCGSYGARSLFLRMTCFFPPFKTISAASVGKFILRRAGTGASSSRSIPFNLDRPRAAVFWSCPECFFSLSDPFSRIRGPLFPSQTRAAFCWLGSTQADYIGT